MKLLKHIFILLFIVFQAVAQEDPRELFKFAKFKFDKAEYEEALNYLDQTLTVDSTYSNAYLLRAEVYYQLEDFKLAIQDLNSAFNIDSAYNGFLNKYHLLKGKAYLRLNQLDKAEETYRELISIDDYYSEVYYELANLQFLKDEPVAAIVTLNKAIKVDPKNGKYYATRAYFTSKTYTIFPGDKNYRAINDDYNLALYLDPDNYEFYKLRSEFKRQMGQEIEALGDYNKMIEIKPEENYAYTERGVLKMHKEKYIEAINDFNSSIELYPNDAKNFKYRGLCHHNMREYYDAYNDFTKSIDILNKELSAVDGQNNIKSQIAQTYLMRGHSLFAMGKGSEACVDFLKALDMGERKGLNYFRKYCRF